MEWDGRAYLTFDSLFRTNLECKQGRKGRKSPYLIQAQIDPYLSSDRDSIAVDRVPNEMDSI
jgi:hypothetical protein